MPTLYLMLGFPGAGKTTTAQHINTLTGAVHLNSDVVRLELFPQPAFTQAEHDALYQEINRRTRDYLQQGQSVIYDANLNRFIHRQEKYDLCKQLGADCRLIWVQTPKSIAKERRIEEIAHHRFVPKRESPGGMFDRLVDVFEPPTANEPHVVIDGEKITPAYVKDSLSL